MERQEITSYRRQNLASCIAGAIAVACVGVCSKLAVENYVLHERLRTHEAKMLEATIAVSKYKQLLLGPHPARSMDDPVDLVTCPICGGASAMFPGDFCDFHRAAVSAQADSQVKATAVGNESTVQAWCNSPENVVVTRDEVAHKAGVVAAAVKMTRAIQHCGFAFFDNLYDTQLVDRWKTAYDTFAASDLAEHFRYPCQGSKRTELMLPFKSPFNETHVYGHSFLRTVLAHTFDGAFKMELQTVINSPAGSGHQRWHQGWRSLFKLEEKQPRPYGLIVGVALEDLDSSMGPTEFCAGYNRRFYNGLRCPELPVAAAMTKGGVYIFDYSLLHRGCVGIA